MTDQTTPIQDSPNILSHVSLGTDDMTAALAFYDQVMPTIGAKRVYDAPEHAVAYGKQFPEFWVHPPHNQQATTVGNGTHIAFIAWSREQVNAFYDAAIAAGASCDGAPGERPLYGPAYYGCFLRDPDGHKIEAMFWDESRLAEQEA